MANFCLKCGAELRPDSKFCPVCGKPVRPSPNGVRVSREGKGLKFDVPEGSKVTISDPSLKEKTSASRNKTSRGFPAKLLIILLAAVVGFTGFVKPGFFLPKKKDPVSYTVPSAPRPSASAVPKEEPVQTAEPLGNSKPFTSSPCEGIMVSAEENAFRKDTSVQFTELEELPEAYASLETELESQGLIPVAGWEVDAGLADDEVIPGSFKVEIDLNTLGIDPLFYPCLSVGRAGEDGSFYEYAVTVNGDTLTYESRQNSVTMVLIGGAAVILAGAKGIDYIKESSYFWSRKDYFKRNVEVKTYDSGYGSYEVQWMTKEIDPSVGDKIDRIHEIEEECRQEANEYRQTLQNTSKFEKNKEMADHYKYLLETNEEYKQLKQEVKVPKAIEETVNLINTAYKYLSTVAHVRMPTGKVIFLARTDSSTSENRDKLGLAEKLNYSTIVSLWPLKGLATEVDRDNYLLTITHELFHVCQERYRMSPPVADKLTDDPRFDEMVTMVLERDAKEYYWLNDIILNDPPLTDKDRWDMLRLPADSEPDSAGTADGKNVKMKEGYQLGDFVMYLQEQYTDRVVTPHQLMMARSYIAKPTTSDPIREAFGITEAEYDLYFRKWLIARRGTIQSLSVQNFNEAAYYPKDWIKVKRGEFYHVPLDKDSSYFMSLRGFQKSEKGDMPALVIFDDNFRKNHPSVNLVPLDSYSSLNKGAYFRNLTVLTMMEIYGKLDPAEDMNVGYTMWVLNKTPAPFLQETENALVIQLPKAQGAAAAGVIDGVILKLSQGERIITETEIAKEGFGQAVNYDKAGLYQDGKVSGQMEITATLCEYVKDTDGNICRGIESDPVRIMVGTAAKPESNARTYTNLYLYKDRTCEFDGDVVIDLADQENYTIGAWPKDNTVVINGNQVQVTLGAVNWTAGGYDKEDNKIRSDLTCIREQVVLTGEFVNDYGEDHYYYTLKSISPGSFTGTAVETGTEREGYYSSGVTTYQYFPYTKQYDTEVLSMTEGIVDVYFKNGDISSVEISIKGPCRFRNYYYLEEEYEKPHENTSEKTLALKISLLR